MKTDVRPVSADLYFLPVRTRLPLKFGAEVLTSITCARVCLTVEDRAGRTATGWGETPLSVQWVWPGNLSYQDRQAAIQEYCIRLARDWPAFGQFGHPLELGSDFIEQRLPELLGELNRESRLSEPMPRLAALVCFSAFDIAVHDAFGNLHERDIYTTYNRDYMNRDLSALMEPAEGSGVDFRGLYPEDFLVLPGPATLTAWHAVGGLDPLEAAELKGDEPDDDHPVLLSDWIERDELDCLKIKLCGNDAAWDLKRLIDVGRMALEGGVTWLTTDFNCTVTQPEYVNQILDTLMIDHPRIHQMILYVEQPFPYELEKYNIDVHSVSARKPLFMDESAHDWRMVRLGRKLGWTGVALKTCKTQTGALLSLCWAKAHGMTLMVQDLTNPMLAQVTHCRLGAHAGTIAGLESNSVQFYPAASGPEEKIHPGLYRRRGGKLDLSTIRGPGFGYRLDEIERRLPEPVKLLD